ncbi:MAG: class I SAM-dependent methyltransferase [Ferruginibacter sp.]
MLRALKTFFKNKIVANEPRPSSEAYDLWSDSYDVQPGNLMLDLDEIIFMTLLADVELSGKTVADIGCGTGRHWPKLYAKSPASLVGYDVSEGMLGKLKCKFPGAVASKITDNRLLDTASDSLDCIVSTLTIAHIEELEETIAAWARVLKNGGDILLTDFHPDALVKGGKRTFRHEDKQMSVINFVHSLYTIKEVCKKHGLIAIREEERFVDDSVRSYYENQDALHVYNQFKGMAIIYGLHLKKQHVAE